MATTSNSKLRMSSSDTEFSKRQRKKWTNFNGEAGEAV
jgi:hypothetical protein